MGPWGGVCGELWGFWGGKGGYRTSHPPPRHPSPGQFPSRWGRHRHGSVGTGEERGGAAISAAFPTSPPPTFRPHNRAGSPPPAPRREQLRAARGLDGFDGGGAGAVGPSAAGVRPLGGSAATAAHRPRAPHRTVSAARPPGWGEGKGGGGEEGGVALCPTHVGLCPRRPSGCNETPHSLLGGVYCSDGRVPPPSPPWRWSLRCCTMAAHRRYAEPRLVGGGYGAGGGPRDASPHVDPPPAGTSSRCRRGRRGWRRPAGPAG